MIRTPELRDCSASLNSGWVAAVGAQRSPQRAQQEEAEVGLIRLVLLPAEVWSPLVSYKPPYILDRNGTVQHEPLAKLLREKGFDTDRRIECEPWGSGLVFRQEPDAKE